MPCAVVGAGDEVADHLLGPFEVRDHAVAQRTAGHDVGRRATEHAPGFGSDRQHLAGALAHRHHRRLIEHDAPAAYVDERVGGPEVDADVGRPDPQHGREQVQGVWKSWVKMWWVALDHTPGSGLFHRLTPDVGYYRTMNEAPITSRSTSMANGG